MSAAVSKAARWEWPADVLEFAAQRKLEPYLEPLLQATHRAFPTARWVKVQLQEDLVIEDYWQTIFIVRVVGLTPTQAVAAMNQWADDLFQCCPAPLAPSFGLMLDPTTHEEP